MTSVKILREKVIARQDVSIKGKIPLEKFPTSSTGTKIGNTNPRYSTASLRAIGSDKMKELRKRFEAGIDSRTIETPRRKQAQEIRRSKLLEKVKLFEDKIEESKPRIATLSERLLRVHTDPTLEGTTTSVEFDRSILQSPSVENICDQIPHAEMTPSIVEKAETGIATSIKPITPVVIDSCSHIKVPQSIISDENETKIEKTDQSETETIPSDITSKDDQNNSNISTDDYISIEHDTVQVTSVDNITPSIQYNPEDLLTAVTEGNTTKVTQLINSGVPFTAVNSHGQAALTVAVLRNDLESATALIEGKADLNQQDSSSFTPLVCAAAYGFSNLVQTLVTAQADIEIQTRKGSTALMTAVVQGSITNVDILLNSRANLHTRSEAGYSALMLSIEKHNIPLCKKFLEYKADPNIQISYGGGGTSLHRVARSDKHTDMIELLVQAKGDLETLDLEGNTPLIVASSRGHVENVALLVKSGANINACGQKACTALMSASSSGFLPVVQFLIEVNCDVNACAQSGTTAIMMAAWNGHTDVATFLIKHGANLNKQNEFGVTAIMSALPNGHTDVVKVLVDARADITLANQEGYTALMLAVELSQMDIVAILYQAEQESQSLQHRSPMESLLEFDKHLASISSIFHEYNKNSKTNNIAIADSIISFLHGDLLVFLSQLDYEDECQERLNNNTCVDGNHCSKSVNTIKTKSQFIQSQKQEQDAFGKIAEVLKKTKTIVVDKQSFSISKYKHIIIPVLIVILAICVSFFLMSGSQPQSPTTASVPNP